MFLFWMKPKSKKRVWERDYHHEMNVYGWVAIPQVLFSIAWFVCIPFLLMDFKATIKPFFIVTALTIAFELLSKALDPHYKYF